MKVDIQESYIDIRFFTDNQIFVLDKRNFTWSVVPNKPIVVEEKKLEIPEAVVKDSPAKRYMDEVLPEKVEKGWARE